eukprot:scaffold1054_cov366-Prasinococcus_capsulatus_cf.AAC.12
MPAPSGALSTTSLYISSGKKSPAQPQAASQLSHAIARLRRPETTQRRASPVAGGARGAPLRSARGTCELRLRLRPGRPCVGDELAHLRALGVDGRGARQMPARGRHGLGGGFGGADLSVHDDQGTRDGPLLRYRRPEEHQAQLLEHHALEVDAEVLVTRPPRM